MVAQHGQSIATGNACHTRQRIKSKQKQTKNEHNVRWTVRKQTQLTLIRHGPSYKQLEVKTNRTSFVYGNHNTEPET